MHDNIIRSHINGQFLMNVWPNQTIHEIKQEVLDMWNIPINRQRLGSSDKNYFFFEWGAIQGDQLYCNRLIFTTANYMSKYHKVL
jgi:hypothetical protein